MPTTCPCLLVSDEQDRDIAFQAVFGNIDDEEIDIDEEEDEDDEDEDEEDDDDEEIEAQHEAAEDGNEAAIRIMGLLRGMHSLFDPSRGPSFS